MFVLLFFCSFVLLLLDYLTLDLRGGGPLAAAPEGEAAHAGAFRNIVKGVSDLQQLEMEDYAPQQQHQEAERQELPGNPVCLVQSNDRQV